MRQISFSRPSSLLADSAVLILIGAFIYSLTIFGHQWEASFNPTSQISTSMGSLVVYTAFSALRGLIAYLISLTFTICIGYWAAKSAKAERIILPFLDIMQSIPVLGFLPGLVLGLVAIFPKTNVGLELASILMIFTGQVWNMTFAFYSSLKSVPTDLKESATVMKLTWSQRLKYLELPFSAMNLTWNSVMSMAGGWFFLTVCEAFTLGNQTYRLPGLGAYMAVAIETGEGQAIVAGILAMAFVILTYDIILWRPALVWAHRFRLEDNQNQKLEEPLIQLLIKRSSVMRVTKVLQYFLNKNRTRLSKRIQAPAREMRQFKLWAILGRPLKYLRYPMYLVVISLIGYLAVNLLRVLSVLSLMEWLEILRDTAFTFCRVVVAVVIGTLWATPAAIWIAQSPRRLQIMQPIVQLMASFPAPMLYPLAIAVFLYFKFDFEFGSMLLMLLGVQWYILFNVLAGALRIPSELQMSMNLMNSSKWQQWRYLYIPSVLPALVTGWVTAAGGAWNASIVAELVVYKGQVLKAQGLGALISQAAEHGNFAKLAACLTVMVIFVVILNRTFWSKMYKVAQVRFRMDL
jgi:NitT/TauT family transport system permease protein